MANAEEPGDLNSFDVDGKTALYYAVGNLM